MKRILIAGIFCSAFLQTNCQIVVENTQTVAWYVQNVLVGSGVTVSNIVFQGAPEQFGYFDAQNCSIDIDYGICMSSGEILGMVGPASNTFSGNANPPFPTGIGDPDLLTVAQSVTTNPSAGNITTTNDAAILEFDFVPNGDTVKFDFVFASDEYNTWINTVFNDAFGFFVAGPGIVGPFSSPAGFPNGSINVALVPGTNIPITISTIYDEPTEIPPLMNEEYYVSNVGDTTHTHNAFTTPISAQFPVQCGQVYHFKFAVADCQDNFLATSVFLAGGSFSSSEAIQADLSLSTGVSDTILFEGCGLGLLTFHRFSNIENEGVVDLLITGVATNGTDYTNIPAQVVFAAGDSITYLPILAFADGLAEGFEVVVLEITNSQTACGFPVTSVFTFSIADDPLPLVLSVSDYDIDCGEEIQIGGLIEQGYGNYLYNWSSGQTDSSIYVSPGYTTDYILTITDTCNLGSITDTITVNVPVYPPMEVDIPASVNLVCTENTDIIPNIIAGGTGIYTYEWVQNGVVIATTPTLNFTAANTTILTFNVYDECGSLGTDYIQVIVPVIPIEIFPSPDTSICLGDWAVISALVSGGEEPYTYSWLGTTNTTNALTVTPAVTSTYTFQITDLCLNSESVNINVGVEYIDAGFSISPLETYGFNTNNVTEQHSNSASEIYYLWDFGDGNYSTDEEPTYFYTDLDYHDVILTATNNIGCTDTAHIGTIPPATLYIPNSFSPNGDGINDVFGVQAFEIEEFEMDIYDRWGRLVFHSNNVHEKWNGSGKDDSEYFTGSGVYVYKIRTVNRNNEKTSFFGNITVVR